MDAQIVLRLSSRLKDQFFVIAEKQGIDPSKIIRGMIESYVEEHSEKDEIQIMVDAGKSLQKALGGFKKARFHASNLNRVREHDINKFIENVISLHAQHELHIPTQLVKAKENKLLAHAYMIGLLGD